VHPAQHHYRVSLPNSLGYNEENVGCNVEEAECHDEESLFFAKSVSEGASPHEEHLVEEQDGDHQFLKDCNLLRVAVVMLVLTFQEAEFCVGVSESTVALLLRVVNFIPVAIGRHGGLGSASYVGLKEQS